jgi:asparagine synthase (glutamine-hydrolysing)
MTCLSFDYIEQRQYWDLEYPDKKIPQLRSSEEIIMEVERRLREAVRLRLRSDPLVGIGFYLSGGIDSAAICGVAAKLIEEQCIEDGKDIRDEKKRFKCFCIGFDNTTNFDETGNDLLIGNEHMLFYY